MHPSYQPGTNTKICLSVLTDLEKLGNSLWIMLPVSVNLDGDRVTFLLSLFVACIGPLIPRLKGRSKTGVPLDLAFFDVRSVDPSFTTRISPWRKWTLASSITFPTDSPPL